MSEVINSLGTLNQHAAAFPWPGDFFSADDLPAFLDHIHVVAWEHRGGTFGLQLAFEGECAVNVPGLDGVSLVLGAGIDGYTLVDVVGKHADPSTLTLQNIRAAVRFSPDLLTPAPDEDGNIAAHAEIYVEGSITIDANFDVHVDGFNALTLTPVMVGASGVVLSASDVKLDLSRTSSIPEVLAAGFDESFLGVFIGEAKVELPPGMPALAPEDLILTNAAIGSGGVSGTLAATYTPTYDDATKQFTGRGAGELFGVPFGLHEVDLSLRANAFERARMSGELLLPFFDAPVGVDLGITHSGALTVDVSSDDGLATLHKPGVVDVELDSLGFEVTGDRFVANVSGTIKPLVGGLDWPAFHVDKLTIDSDGNVKLDGGWLDLSEQYSLDFHGFALEITKIGFGKSDDGGKWIGFSGGLSFTSKLRAGASVEGLRVIWYDDGREPKITLEGVSVQLDIPDVMRFDGRVAYRELEQDGLTVHRFDGAIKVDLVALEMSVDGRLVIGRAAGETFLAIDLGFDLPAGIPLFATGLALYGLEGMFALGMEPGRLEDETWYGWYKRAPEGATELEKWTNRSGSLALGAGVTIGTAADNGFTFASKALLAIIFPGPILVIDGKANLFRKRTTLAEDPLFHAFAIIDKRLDTLTFGLDAHYKYASSGKLIDIAGSAEAYFNLSAADDWHLYLGQRDPRSKRIRASFLSVVEGDAYFMIDPRTLATGVSAGWGHHWKFGPLRVGLEAFLEVNATMSRKPVHWSGDAWLHGKAGLKVYGYGVDLSIDVKLGGDVSEPYHLLGELSVGIGLPWPLPDFDVDIPLEWGPDPIFPALPAPLEEVAIEHFKVTTSWPLALGELVVPRLDNGDGFFDASAPTAAPPDSAPPPASAPVVPLDARPHLTFTRAMNDDAFAGVNGRETDPERERIGDPEKDEGPVLARFGLRELALDAWHAGAWQTVARSVGPSHPIQNPPGLARLYGSWAPMPNLPDLTGDSVAQVKLWLWSKTPFDWSRKTGAQWDEWFTNSHDDYACPDRPPREVICWDFSRLALGDELLRPWTHPDEPELLVSWLQSTPQVVVPVVNDDDVTVPGLCIHGRYADASTHAVKQNAFVMQVPVPNVGVRLGVRDPEKVIAVALQADGTHVGPILGGNVEPVVDIPGTDIRYILIVPRSRACLYRICIVTGLSDEELDHRDEIASHTQEELVRWSQADNVLEPDTEYRIRVVTTIEADGEGELSGSSFDIEHVQLAYFRTEGPPGLTLLSPPSAGELDLLTPYVRQTTPATVPASGEKPVHVKPVYRAYDVGVAFNENYVELMYRLARRDLGLYLFDGNNRPARDAAGRLLVATYRWDLTPDAPMTDAESWWLTVINESTCTSFDTSTVVHDTAMTTVGHVLDPDRLHEARLIPLLLHDDFTTLTLGDTASGTGATLGGWEVHDLATIGGPSVWTTLDNPDGRALAQISNVGGGSIDAGDAVKPGTLLLRESVHGDYRAGVYIRSSTGGAIGIAVRVLSATRFILFVMDRNGGYRRIVRVFDNEWTILAEDDFIYAVDRDYFVEVDAEGDELRVFVDGEPVFTVNDTAYPTGGIALYAWRCPDARFKDVRVDDLGATAPVLYRFTFTTSQFANFTHHIQSHQDDIWLSPPINPSLLGPAVDPTVTISEDEARAYEGLASAVLGPAATDFPRQLRITRIADAGLLLEASEPIDWRRLTITAETSARLLAAPVPPASDTSSKLIDAVFPDLAPTGEQATVLLRETANISALRVERLALPGPFDEGEGDTLFHAERFGEHPGGVLLEERFGPNALDHYDVLDEGTNSTPSAWSVSGGVIRQTSNIWGGQVDAASPVKPGTVAMTGDPAWTNIRVSATIRSHDDDAIGIAVRCAADGSSYRFVMDSERAYRRLLKISGGATAVLWEDDVAYDVGRAYRVAVECFGALIAVFVEDDLICAVVDADLVAGRVGLCCWANQDARFELLRVEMLEESPILAVLDPSDATTWRAGTAGAPVLLGGDDSWDDVVVSTSLRSLTGGPVGLLFRAGDEYNHYRLILDPTSGLRTVVRRIEGEDSVLWQVAVATPVAVDLRVTIRVVGPHMTATMNGAPLFDLYDGALVSGGIGVLGGAMASFGDVAIANARRMVSDWRIADTGTIDAPSRWYLGHGGLTQRSSIRGGLEIGSDPAKPGTHAIGGPVLTDMRFATKLRSDGDGAIGVVFRWNSANNHYRFSCDRSGGYRRLVRVQDGVVTTLWEASGSYVPGTSFNFMVDMIGTRLVGHLGGVKLFDVRDAAHAEGRIGFYAWKNPGARFEAFELSRPPLSAHVLFADTFGDGSLSSWTVEDLGTFSAPSQWVISNGTANQTSGIFSPPTDPTDPAELGTHLITGDAASTDVIVSTRLLSNAGGAMGVAFRYKDADNYYRFSMGRQDGYRRLIKCVGGVFKVLWEDGQLYELGRAYEIAIVAVGRQLRGFLDGVPVFDVIDDELQSGKIALYCCRDDDARFAQVRVHEVSAAFTEWTIDDTFAQVNGFRWSFAGAGQWSAEPGALLQTNASETFAIASDAPRPDLRVSSMVRANEGTVGIAVAWRGPNDHVRVELDLTSGKTRIISSDGGVSVTKAEAPATLLASRDYLVTVDLVGTRVVAYVDGVEQLAIDDAPVGTGRIALYTSNASSARFAYVRAAPPRWTTYSTFAGAMTPAGTRLVAAPEDMARFTGDDVRLRLVERAPTGDRRLHERSFLRDAAYVPTPLRVIRRLDGAALALAVALSPGQLRIRTQFARTGVTGAPDLSEGGATDAELTALDVSI